ncbi:MAG: hypothetical protein JSR33_05290 [Proteobacteria bacterium]|nr:hypothetical protein [Pseudomonadota bacterium]
MERTYFPIPEYWYDILFIDENDGYEQEEAGALENYLIENEIIPENLEIDSEDNELHLPKFYIAQINAYFQNRIKINGFELDPDDGSETYRKAKRAMDKHIPAEVKAGITAKVIEDTGLYHTFFSFYDETATMRSFIYSRYRKDYEAIYADYLAHPWSLPYVYQQVLQLEAKERAKATGSIVVTASHLNIIFEPEATKALQSAATKIVYGPLDIKINKVNLRKFNEINEQYCQISKKLYDFIHKLDKSIAQVSVQVLPGNNKYLIKEKTVTALYKKVVPVRCRSSKNPNVFLKDPYFNYKTQMIWDKSELKGQKSRAWMPHLRPWATDILDWPKIYMAVYECDCHGHHDS